MSGNVKEDLGNVPRKATTLGEDYYINNPEGKIQITHTDLKSIKQEMNNAIKQSTIINTFISAGFAIALAFGIPFYQSEFQDVILAIITTFGTAVSFIALFLRLCLPSIKSKSYYSRLDELIERAEEAKKIVDSKKQELNTSSQTQSLQSSYKA